MRRIHTVLLVASLAIACLATAAEAFGDCPETTDWLRCLRKYDHNGDDALNLEEFEGAWDNLAFYVRLVMKDAAHYFERCDVDGDGKIEGLELIGSNCMGNCVKQIKAYSDLCM